MSLHRILLLSLLTACIFVASPARASEGDLLHFGKAIDVPSGASVHDAYCFFCSIHIDGKATGDVFALFGSVDLKGTAQHDLISVFGNVAAHKGASVNDDLISVFGNVHLEENVIVADDLLVVFGTLHEPETILVGGDRVNLPAWLVLLLLLLFALALAIVRHFRPRPYHNTYRSVSSSRR